MWMDEVDMLFGLEVSTRPCGAFRFIGPFSPLTSSMRISRVLLGKKTSEGGKQKAKVGSNHSSMHTDSVESCVRRWTHVQAKLRQDRQDASMPAMGS